MKILLTILTIVFIFSGCSTKQYFEPKNTSNNNLSSKKMSDKILSLSSDGAILENFRVINKDGLSTYFLPEGYTFLNKADSQILSADKLGNIMIDRKTINLAENIVAASIKENILAVVFANNTIALYNLTTNKYTLKEKLKLSIINDTRIANPIFLDKTVIFPTLNGKIIFVSLKTSEIIKNINLDPTDKVNNVIFLKTIGETLIASTPNKILSISDGAFNVKRYRVKDIITNSTNVFVATLNGTIIKFDLTLNQEASKKFKFANIFALGYGTSLYALESQDYLIKINDAFTKTTVYDFSFDESSKTIVINNTLYFDDEYVKLP